MSKIRVGIIGAGANTRLHHIPKLQAIEGVTVVAVANRTKESAEKVASQFSISKATGNWRELIDDLDIDAIVIGTWPYLHRTLTIAALRAGKHVLTEARMAMDAREAREMLQASQENPHLTAMIVPSPASLPWDATLSNILKAGSLGDLVYIEVKSVGGFGNPEFAQPQGSPLTWRNNVDLSGLNIGTLGIFYEIFQRWLGDVSSVQALAKTVVGLRKDEETLELKAVHVPDHLDVLATHPSGANVHFLITSVLGAYQGFRNGFVLYGTKGTLQLDFTTKKLTLGLKEDGAGTDVSLIKEVHVAEERKGAWRVEEEFVGAIRGQEKVTLTDFGRGHRYMEFTEAVTRSIQSGAVVKLPLLD